MSQPINLEYDENCFFQGSSNNLLIAFFSRRLDKNMSLSFGDTRESSNNRRLFCEGLKIDYRTLVCAEQIHDNKIKYVELQDLGKGALIYDTCIKGVDALITDNKDIPLAIFTADCLSVFLYDRGAPAIGLVHAGWRGTKENITPGTLQLMLHQFNSKISDVYVGFGPAIRECCYEVGKEFFELFPDNLYERDNRYYLDLVKINKRQLLDLGVRQENILDSGICTSCSNDKFFSYRKEGNACARMMSVIMLR